MEVHLGWIAVVSIVVWGALILGIIIFNCAGKDCYK